MHYVLESWSLIVILASAFVIGWAAETAQTFIPRALALSILAWLQTLPEFAVEATIAWNQQQDLMIANLTGSLRLLVGLGWPMIFFVHFFFQGIKKRRMIREIHLEETDFLGVVFLFLSIVYFIVILAKGTLTCYDSILLTAVYGAYLYLATRLPSQEEESHDELPWIGQKIVQLAPVPKVSAVTLLFVAGGVALYFSAHPFVETLQTWATTAGISTFIFVQWVAPFLSEFPEKVSAFNWARQSSKAPMAVMNMVNSNINQWTMLAAMIPVVYSLSLKTITPVPIDGMHATELALTIAQSALGGLLLLDMKFSIWDAGAIFLLWFVQFIEGHLREEITWIYCAWIAYELGNLVYQYVRNRHVPPALSLFRTYARRGFRGAPAV